MEELDRAGGVTFTSAVVPRLLSTMPRTTDAPLVLCDDEFSLVASQLPWGEKSSAKTSNCCKFNLRINRKLSLDKPYRNACDTIGFLQPLRY